MGKSKVKKNGKPKKNGKAKPLPEVLTLAEAAEFLRLDEASMLRLANSAEVDGRFYESEWRFSKRALLAWVETLTRPTTNGAELAEHIRRVNAVTGFHETDEEIETFLAGLREPTASETAASK